MNKIDFIGDAPSGTVYIGYERGQWPIHLFATAEDAARWMDRSDAVRYVWRYELTGGVPMELVPQQIIDATLRGAVPDGTQPA